jgi:hypothetical protein
MIKAGHHLRGCGKATGKALFDGRRPERNWYIKQQVRELSA